MFGVSDLSCDELGLTWKRAAISCNAALWSRMVGNAPVTIHGLVIGTAVIERHSDWKGRVTEQVVVGTLGECSARGMEQIGHRRTKECQRESKQLARSDRWR